MFEDPIVYRRGSFPPVWCSCCIVWSICSWSWTGHGLQSGEEGGEVALLDRVTCKCGTQNRMEHGKERNMEWNMEQNMEWVFNHF